jgi:hypothetical protein
MTRNRPRPRSSAVAVAAAAPAISVDSATHQHRQAQPHPHRLGPHRAPRPHLPLPRPPRATPLERLRQYKGATRSVYEYLVRTCNTIVCEVTESGDADKPQGLPFKFTTTAA